MEEHSVAYIAMDTAKLHNVVAPAEAGREGEIRYLGEIENTEPATARLVRRLAKKYDRLVFYYEAGPSGYGLYWQLKEHGTQAGRSAGTERRRTAGALSRPPQPDGGNAPAVAAGRGTHRFTRAPLAGRGRCAGCTPGGIRVLAGRTAGGNARGCDRRGLAGDRRSRPGRDHRGCAAARLGPRLTRTARLRAGGGEMTNIV